MAIDNDASISPDGNVETDLPHRNGNDVNRCAHAGADKRVARELAAGENPVERVRDCSSSFARIAAERGAGQIGKVPERIGDIRRADGAMKRVERKKAEMKTSDAAVAQLSTARRAVPRA